jgi:hypothetical protein
MLFSRSGKTPIQTSHPEASQSGVREAAIDGRVIWLPAQSNKCTTHASLNDAVTLEISLVRLTIFPLDFWTLLRKFPYY